MSLESTIAEIRRKGFRVADLRELLDRPGTWSARLDTWATGNDDYSTGSTPEAALRNALKEITGAPGSERALKSKPVRRRAPPKAAPVDDMEDLLG